jgi:hypothetical protein
MLLSAPVPERSLKFNLIVWNDLDLYPYRQSATDWKKPQCGRPRTSTLETEVGELMKAVSHAYVRGRFQTYSG